MKNIISCFLIVSAVYILESAPLYAYDTPTHSVISLAAIRNSDLALDANLLAEIGLRAEIGLVRLETKQTFPSEIPADENNPQPENSVFQQATISRIITGGSVLEDLGRRSLQHFFDPLNDRPLGPAPSFTVHRSLDWILEINEFGERIEIDTPGQIYSYSDGIDYFYSALTEPEGAERQKNFGLMFRTLGHVIHHIQDMAQPQHTRNDAHCDLARCRIVGQYDPSLYEQHTNIIRNKRRNGERILKHDIFYPIVNFDNVRDYWSSTIGVPEFGSGMADFSNTNFVSQDTNFKLLDNGQINTDAEYPLPVPNLDPSGPLLVRLSDDRLNGFFTEQDLDKIDCLNVPDLNFQCKIEFYSSDINDNNFGDVIETNAWASSLSIFDKELESASNSPELTLNRINFENGFYPYLIPRAVAYSAGLINHFFRGRLFVENVLLNAQGKLEFFVKNVSKNHNGNDVFTKGASEGSGVFSIYYDKAGGGRAELGSVTLAGNESLAVNDSISITVDYPANVDITKEKPFTIVYRGNIGQEEGVAAVVTDVDLDLNGFLVYPSYTPADGFPGRRRLIMNENGVWKSVPFDAGRAGNVDWKGQYVNGKPTRVLTWEGERSRYFPESNYQRNTYIYQGGRAYSRMPCTVLGAAIRKDSGDQEWIVGICASGPGVRVMQRPNTLNLSTAMFDPATAPEGWRELGAYAYSLGIGIYTSWFFNGSGTQAQTVSRSPTSGLPPFHLKAERIKMELLNDETVFTKMESQYPVETFSYNCISTCTDLENGGQCEGIVYQYESEAHEVISETGDYPIAVDYAGETGEQEVVGKVINNRVYRRDKTASMSGSSADTTGFTIHEGKRRLVFGNNVLDLLSEEGSFSKSNATATYSTSGSSNSATFTSALDETSLYEEHNLVYLDLRSGVVMSEDLHYDNYWHGARGAADDKYTETVQGLVFYRAFADTGSGARNTDKIFEVVYGPTASNRTGPSAGDPLTAGSLCNVPENDVYYFKEYPKSIESGIVATTAADIDNRLALSLYISNGLNTSHLEQLDTDQLKQLIPGAPDNPEYEIRLIK